MTARPGAPAYLDMPYSGADIANGAAKPPPAAPRLPLEPDPETAAPRIVARRPLISDIAEEKPIPAGTEDALFQAADKAYRMSRDRIKFHETQLRRWRAVAASFAGLSNGPSPEGPTVTPSMDQVSQFLDLMNNLPEGTT